MANQDPTPAWLCMPTGPCVNLLTTPHTIISRCVCSLWRYHPHVSLSLDRMTIGSVGAHEDRSVFDAGFLWLCVCVQEYTPSDVERREPNLFASNVRALYVFTRYCISVKL